MDSKNKGFIKEFINQNYGPPNEPLDIDFLSELFEEIDSLITDYKLELSIAAIELGKPQILAYILNSKKFNSSYKFTTEEIKQLKKHVESYVNHESKILEKGHKNLSLHIQETIKNFEDIINSYIYDNRYKKKT